MTEGGHLSPPAAAAHPLVATWLRIEPGGQVGASTGKVEIGQGILTGLVQIAADGLGVEPDRIQMASVDTDSSPDEGVTAGSRSIQTGGLSLLMAARTLRCHLVELAAAHLGEDIETLTVDDGTVSGPGGGVVTYWDLAPLVDPNLRITTAAVPAEAPRSVGRSLPRRDLPAKILGRPAYVHDLRFENMVFGRVLRVPGSTLVSADTTEAQSLPGVLGVIRRGSFLGVVADREEHAIRAMRRLQRNARWDPPLPPPVSDPRRLQDAAVPGQVEVHRRSTERINQEIIREATFTRLPLAHASLGPSAAVALRDDVGLTVWSHTQGPFRLRDEIARVLGVPITEVRVIHAEGAGCYGHNGADDAALDAALLADAVPGRPVKLQWSREQEFLWEPYGSAMAVLVRAGLDRHGRIATWTQEVWSHSHTARPGHPDGVRLLASSEIDRALPAAPPGDPPLPDGGILRNAVPLYDIPELDVIRHMVPDPPHRTSALRSLGAHVNVFAIESMIDELADAAAVDRIDFRRRHLSDPRAVSVIEAAVDLAGGLHPRQAEAIGRGLGFARYKNSACYCAVVVELEAETSIRPMQAWAAVDAGRAVNPDGIRNQIEGGIIQSLSWALREQALFDLGDPLGPNWNQYPILGFEDVPLVEVAVIDRPDEPPVGVGEGAQGPATAAVGNALADVLGARIRDLPMTRERVEATLLRQ